MKKTNITASKLTPVKTISVLILVIFLCAACGFKLPLPARETDKNEFDEILSIISERYIGNYNEDELITEAKRAIIRSLDDNWSYYMTADEYEMYLQSSDNTYHGIGVEVEIDDDIGGMKVTYVYNNAGAHNAGIKPGDIITKIDGDSIKGLSIIEIRAMLRRPLDDTVIITVMHDNGEYEDITVTYSIVFQDPVSFEMLGGNIGYVHLNNFEGGSSESFITAVETLIEQGAEAFIYDVRSNNGGRVNEVTAILDFLLPEGEIFIAVDGSGEEIITYSKESFINLPSVVLVNTYSFSGAEYMTAVLSEYNYSVTVGEQTTGKNRMQSTIPLSDGSAVHISTGMFLTPNRIDLYEQGGYTPDYVIDFTDEEYERYYRRQLSFDDDPQVQKAIELLKDFPVFLGSG